MDATQRQGQVTETGQGVTHGEFVLHELVREFLDRLRIWRDAEEAWWEARGPMAAITDARVAVDAAELALREAVGR